MDRKTLLPDIEDMALRVRSGRVEVAFPPPSTFVLSSSWPLPSPSRIFLIVEFFLKHWIF